MKRTARDGRQWQWWSVLLMLALLLALFLVVSAIGAVQAARDERVFRVFEPATDFLRDTGWQWLQWLVANVSTLGWAITGTASAIALVGLIVAGRRAMPLFLLAGGVSLASWGQIQLLGDGFHSGIWLYLLGMVSFVLLGAWCPLKRLHGMPQPPQLDVQTPATAPQTAATLWEAALILVLALAGLLTRTYALTELPQPFDAEMIDSMVMSRTFWSLGTYFRFGFMTNSAGIVHLLPGPLLFGLFGTSLYTLRLEATFFGFVAIPLLYALVRRMAGVGGAVAAAVLMITAPEQLYWSRLETGGFVPIPVLGLLTAHLGWWMVQRFSFWAVLSAALWIPLCRYFYAPGYIMFLYPLFLYGHAVVFVRRAWRAAWYVLPLLGAGMVLWIFSLSLVFSYITYGQWRFVHPAVIFGAPVWRMHGQGGFRDASLPELVKLQALAMAKKSGEVLAGVAYHNPGMFSQWFQRVSAMPDRLTILNAGTTVVVALGIAYLLGQLADRRAWVLLLWFGFGVAPAILSDEATTRRLALAFPAMYAIAGIVLTAAVALVRTRASRFLAQPTAVVLAIAVCAMAGSNLVSHFMLNTGPVWVTQVTRFSAPLLRNSNVILHSLEPAVAKVVLLGNLDTFLDSPPCFAEVADADWLKAAINLPCNFDGYAYQMTIPPERRATLREAHRPRRVTFLLERTPYSEPELALLQSLYPGAEVRGTRFMQNQRALVSLTVDLAEVEALRSPSLWVSPDAGDHPGLEAELLEGMMLRRVERVPTSDQPLAGIVVRGGLLLERDGWYRFQIGTECAEAHLTLDGAQAARSELRPMLAGVHPFEVTLPSITACQLPLQILMESSDQPGISPVPPSALVSPTVAALPQARAQAVLTYEGYGDATVLARWTGGAVDFGIDARGRVFVLIQESGRYRVQQFAPDGAQESTWIPGLEPGTFARAMAVDGDGTTAIIAGNFVVLRDAEGNETTWRPVWDAVASDIAFAPGGEILLAVPSRNAIAVFERDGTLRGELQRFEGGPGQLTQPQALGISPEGRLLVAQDDGHTLIFDISADVLHATLLRRFKAAFSHFPIEVRGVAFAGPQRVLLPDPTANAVLVYDARGQRLIATPPERDLSAKGSGAVLRLISRPDALYAMDASNIWRLAR
jgi:hypothetical protein